MCGWRSLPAVHRAELRVAEHLGLDRLQRHLLAGEGVAREIHRASGALAEQLLDVVLADLQAEVERETGFFGHVSLACKLSAQCTSIRASSPCTTNTRTHSDHAFHNDTVGAL
jgi:hypothetical protein